MNPDSYRGRQRGYHSCTQLTYFACHSKVRKLKKQNNWPKLDGLQSTLVMVRLWPHMALTIKCSKVFKVAKAEPLSSIKTLCSNIILGRQVVKMRIMRENNNRMSLLNPCKSWSSHHWVNQPKTLSDALLSVPVFLMVNPPLTPVWGFWNKPLGRFWELYQILYVF